MISNFEQIGSLTEDQTNLLVDRVEEAVLVISLKMSSEALREKIFSTIGEDKAAILQKKMEDLGAVRVDDVENNQGLIIEAANQILANDTK